MQPIEIKSCYSPLKTQENPTGNENAMTKLISKKVTETK